MSNNSHDKLCIRVNIEITAAALQAIVAYAKQAAQKNSQGSYHIDTADQVSEMITRFLEEKDFEGYTRNIANAKPTFP